MKLRYYIGIAILLTGNSCQRFTPSDQLINRKASLPSGFKLSELHQKVISSFIDKKENTISILYGNDGAVQRLSANAEAEQAKASFTLVTWRQQEDPHWFGARIPGDLLSIEQLVTMGKTNWDYHRFSGKQLVAVADTNGRTARIKLILEQKLLILP